MPDQTTMSWAELRRQRPMTKYYDGFGQRVPSAMLKYAANMLCADFFNEILLDHIKHGVPIENWDTFAVQFRT